MPNNTFTMNQPDVSANNNMASAQPNVAANPNNNPANVLSEAGKQWMDTKADSSYGQIINDTGVYDNPYAQRTEASDQYGRKYGTGNYTVWGDGTVTVSDGYQNIMGRFDSAGNWHPSLSGDNQYLADSWAESAKNAILAGGHQFNGDGSEWANYENPSNAGGNSGGKTTLSYQDLVGKVVPGYYDPNDPFSDYPTMYYDMDYLQTHGPIDLEKGMSYQLMSPGGGAAGSDGRWYPFSSADIGIGLPPGSLGGGTDVTVGGGGGGYGVGTGTSDSLSALIQQIQQSSEETPKSIEELNGLIDSYGTDWDALRQRLQQDYGTTDLSQIREALAQMPSIPDLNMDTSDEYKAAQKAYEEAIGKKTTLNFEDPDRSGEEYNPNDYTQQINELYDKNFENAKTQIMNQLEQGELTIDQAIAKLPAIYEAGMNDMATQYEINKRNANEYNNANGLSSGAKAQAALAMNNVYQSNMAAYRLEQANAIQEYEDQRAQLRLQAENAVTEALMQNDSERSAAILAEYQRQDQQNFQVFLQKMDNDYKYYALQTEQEIQRATLEESQRKTDMDAQLQIMDRELDRQYKNNQLKMQQAEMAMQQWQFTVSTGMDIAKLEETIRQRGIDTELSIAQLAQRDGEFKINAKMNVAQLAEQMRQFGIDTNITLAKLAEQQREFNINTSMSQAELKEKIRQFNASLQLQQQELQLKREQITANIDLSNRELQEKIRQADMDYEAAMRKLGQGGGYTGGDQTPTTGTQEIESFKDMLKYEIKNRNDDMPGQGPEFENESSLEDYVASWVYSFLNSPAGSGWTIEQVYQRLKPILDTYTK